MAPRSVLEMTVAPALGRGVRASSAEVDVNSGVVSSIAESIVKGGMAGMISEAMIPKSWFSDPFTMLDQMGLGYRATPSAVTYDTLSSMAERNIIACAIHQTRINQVASFTQRPANPYSVGMKVKHKDPRHKLSDSEREYIRDIEGMILDTGEGAPGNRDDFDTFIRKLVRDRLTYDQICVEKVQRRDGKLHSFFVVPAETIRMAYPKRKKGTPYVGDEADDIPAYVQIIDGRVVNDYTRKEMAFGVANPRSNLRVHGYGYSELEMSITTVTAHLWAEEWNRKMFSQGSTIKGIFNVKGNVPESQMTAFKRQWLAQVSGVTNAWRTPILNADGVEWIPLQLGNTEMGYQQWLEYLIKIFCAVYLIDPSEINFDTRAGVGNQPMFMTTNEAQQKVSKDRGLQPLLRFVQNFMNRHILSDIDPRFEFAFVGLDAKTEAEAIELSLKEVGSYKTLNEVRRDKDLPPLPDGDVPLNAVFTGYKQQKAMAAQPGGMPGMPGQSGAPAGDDQGQGPEALQHLFENKDGSPKQHGKVEAQAGKNVKQDAGKPEPWAFEAVHASMSRRRSPLTAELSKALREFDSLEE